jgi:hypothetical protein
LLLFLLLFSSLRENFSLFSISFLFFYLNNIYITINYYIEFTQKLIEMDILYTITNENCLKLFSKLKHDRLTKMEIVSFLKLLFPKIGILLCC